ncbi:hypothetical protein D9X30_4477 [Cupriavidus sp. U2]|uniref:hypothetical protein n=1 Tax=Cupriavidus sp. U2 TaxID=2920269 RepID=UPI00129E0D8D|nr:hypothetical protein [Cupriavidus sp. U2]KAI3590992.1 hypothetical protein D9X30_4477 [Cupriavidus sp. U2]
MAHPAGHTPATRDASDALGLTILSLARHRSLDRLSLSASTMIGIFLLPVLFNSAEWLLRGKISMTWTAVLAFWIDKLGMDGVVIERLTRVAWFDFDLPYLNVTATPPDVPMWSANLLATLIVCIFALRMHDRFLPLRYFLLFAVFIQCTALLFFAVAPTDFPYTVSEYANNMLKTSASFLFLLPWGHALVYYIFDFSWPKKILLTLLTLVFVIVAVPMQLALHVYVMKTGSLLMMPLLSFVFGPTMIVLGCMALYGWAMSWDRQTPRA